MTENKNLFNMLVTGEVKQFPVTFAEKNVLITAINREIDFRLENCISFETAEDIVCLRNTLENLEKI